MNLSGHCVEEKSPALEKNKAAEAAWFQRQNIAPTRNLKEVMADRPTQGEGEGTRPVSLLDPKD